MNEGNQNEPQVFRLRPISRGTYALLWIAVMTFIIPVAVLWLTPTPPLGMAVVMTPVLVGLAGLFGWFAVMQRRSTIVVTERDVILNITLYGRTIARDHLVVDSITKATMKNPGPHRLAMRTNGLSVPGYQLGWFTTQGVGRVLAAISDNDLVVWRTRDNYGVVVSVQDSDGLIAALRNDRARVV
jgi:hypothetical protein